MKAPSPNGAARLAALVHGEGGAKREVIMVSSGAVAEGMKRLGWQQRPKEIHEPAGGSGCRPDGPGADVRDQAARAKPGQRPGAADPCRPGRPRALPQCPRHLADLAAPGVVPVINENDTVVNDEIKFGDNDTLGALVANLVEADALVILTDQKGLYTADPRKNPDAQFVHEAQAGDLKLEAMAGGAGSGIGKGGMLTKILAAKRAAGSGASTVIAWGREQNVLLRLAAGEAIGTLLVADTHKNQARKQWMMDHLQMHGYVTVDEGAALKLRSDGKSLLPIGMVSVHGEFSRGEVIGVRDPQGVEPGTRPGQLQQRRGAAPVPQAIVRI